MSGDAEKGTMTLEAVIAFGIFMLSIGSVAVTAFSSQQFAVETELAMTDRLAAESAISRARTLSFGAIAHNVGLSVTIDSPFAKRVSATEHSAGSRGAPVALETVIIDRVHAGGSHVCPALAINGTTFLIGGSVTLSSSANRGTGVTINGRYAYLSTDSAITGDPDLFVIDISNQNTPYVVSSLNTGPGIAAIATDGEYVYAANTSRTAQLQIISVRDPFHPLLASSLRLTNVTGTGSQGVGNAIAVRNGAVYLGLTKTATGPEFHIIDASDPLAPSDSGGWAAGTKINGIAIEGSYAFVATPTADQLRTLDVSDPERPTFLASFRPGDPATNNGQAVALFGSRAAFGRNAGATAPGSAAQLFMIDLHASSSLSALSAISIGATVNAIAHHTGRLLLATKDASANLQLWDGALPANPTLITSKMLPAPPTAIACNEAVIALALDSNRALQLIMLTP